MAEGGGKVVKVLAQTELFQGNLNTVAVTLTSMVAVNLTSMVAVTLVVAAIGTT